MYSTVLTSNQPCVTVSRQRCESCRRRNSVRWPSLAADLLVSWVGLLVSPVGADVTGAHEAPSCSLFGFRRQIFPDRATLRGPLCGQLLSNDRKYVQQIDQTQWRRLCHGNCRYSRNGKFYAKSSPGGLLHWQFTHLGSPLKLIRCFSRMSTAYCRRNISLAFMATC